MGRHRKPPVDQQQRDEWKDEYRSLSAEIHKDIREGTAVPEEKSNRLKALGRYLRAQSGD